MQAIGVALKHVLYGIAGTTSKTKRIPPLYFEMVLE